MSDAHVVHFACHGSADLAIPSQSGLVLLEDDEESAEGGGGTEKLTISRISNANIRQGFVAYLSACSTAEINTEMLVDEVLHVAAGFQAAGFRHVLASLWPVRDDVSVAAARAFYSYLVTHLAEDADQDDVVARAAHYATAELRNTRKFKKQPLHWVNFVHFGV
ncbi:TPR-like protein [Emericellopsis cladophorae]|uniref:TPR-like protein n=1 Tax=Emericellopsis cladophorae TaxID=2686198 RepID=A0A9P9XUM9_9HYPO|nr:TPR-like protein [Emericellopsis cladophorae]KAI6777825.1 TPR-like protein [Emericellopsis cladophorae]